MSHEPASPGSLPETRTVITVDTEGHDLNSGVSKMNPILQEILQAGQGAEQGSSALVKPKFGRLTFSQTGG